MAEKEHVSFHDQISRNKWKSFFLIFIVFAVLVGITYVFGLIYSDFFFVIMIFGIIISIVYIGISYYFSDKIALASIGAKEAGDIQYRQLHNTVEGLCIASGMPKPRIYIMSDPQINAFATGRNPQNSVICVTTGALEKLNKQELEGVIGHELSHIANYDIRFMTLVSVLVGMIAIVSEIFLRSLWFRGGSDREGKGNVILMIIGLVLAILAPIIVQLVQLAISRKREFMADASSVKFTRYPRGLISALKKIDSDVSMKTHQVPKAVAPLFISEPFKERMSSLLSTHPPIKARVAALERM